MKPYELTDMELKLLFRHWQGHNDCFTLQQVTAHAAQKKLLEYLNDGHMLDHFIDDFITGKHHPTCKACQLLKNFGIGEK